MASAIPFSADDKELDDAALWAVIDSAAASHSSSKPRKPNLLAIKPSNNYNYTPPVPNFTTSPPFNHKPSIKTRNHNYLSSDHNSNKLLTDGEVLHESTNHHRPQKIARYCVSESSENSPPSPCLPLAVVKHVQRTPPPTVYGSPQGYMVTSTGSGTFSGGEHTPISRSEEKVDPLSRHSLSGQFPSVSLFKEYQNAAMAILEKGDFTMISGNPFIKKTGWRKISFFFNLSFEIKDKTIEFDDNRHVQRAEFIVRAYMGSRFSDGWGSCERREKRFLKPNHDIPSTAETRAKNKACQDLLGIGEYRPGASHAQL